MRIGFILALLILLQACATTVNTPLAPSVKQKISSVKLHNTVVQDEVQPAVRVSNSASAGAAAGGLIGLAIASNIDAARNKKANRVANAAIEQLWNETLEWDYRALAGELINARVEQAFNIDAMATATPAALAKYELIDSINDLPESSALLYIRLIYGFVDDSKKLRTFMVASMFDKPATALAKSLPKAVYHNFFTYESEALGDGGDTSIGMWLDNDLAAFKAASAKGLNAVGEMLLYDLTPSASENCGRLIEVIVENRISNRPAGVKGTQLPGSFATTNMRAKTGEIISVEMMPDPAASAPAPSC